MIMQSRRKTVDKGATETPDNRGGLYIHVAYCRRKCLYCDFFSAGSRIAQWHRYVDALISELRFRQDEIACPLRTIYIGGGTPSLIPTEEFERLVEALTPFMSEIEEFTIEANPDDVTEEKLTAWKRGGVNRLSIGIQSFQDNLLSAIGRRHDGKTAEESYRLAREYFCNISIDLMFGLPCQTMAMWREDVDKAISLQPEHVSAYSLMYEPGTAMTVLRDNGKLQEMPEETSGAMFARLIERLREAGYDHYEISNFARPGHRSLHNSSYWLQRPYLGIGPSAHSYDGRKCRKANSADLNGYLRHWAPLEGKPDYGYEVTEESLSAVELREEYVMTRLRTREGIPLDDYSNRFGEIEKEALLKRSVTMIEDGMLELKENRLSLSEDAIMVSDSVILAIV